jgi:two-component system response regulator QseB
MKILVVEDEAHVADMLRRALEGFGNSCVVAQDTATAESLLADGAIDAITLDLAMPGTNGLTWLEGMADSQPDLARKTLVVTGQRLEADAVERVAACGAGVLAKPFTLEHLQEALRSQIDRPNHDPRN